MLAHNIAAPVGSVLLNSK